MNKRQLRRDDEIMRWAWWSAWAVMLANLTHAQTFGRHDPTIFTRSVAVDVAFPVLPLILAPVFFTGRRVNR